MYNILICDDDADIRAALRLYLAPEGYGIFEAADGAEALALLARETIHLVLMDLMMPQLDGVSATAQLRQRSNVPVIMLTAKSEDADKVLGLNVGADDYITKPFSPLEVQARVRSHPVSYTHLTIGASICALSRAGGRCRFLGQRESSNPVSVR